jgi:hypothetical protein
MKQREDIVISCDKAADVEIWLVQLSASCHGDWMPTLRQAIDSLIEYEKKSHKLVEGI